MNSGHEFDLEYQKFLGEKAEVKKNGSEAGRYMANLRWHINLCIRGKGKEVGRKKAAMSLHRQNSSLSPIKRAFILPVVFVINLI